MSVTFSNADGPIVIGFDPAGGAMPHTSPYPTVINVTNLLNKPVASLKVELTNFLPPVLPDLGLLLVSPNGTKMNLLAGAGKDDDQLAPVTITLDDNANHTTAQFLVDGQSYKPTQNNFEYVNYPNPAPSGPYSNPGTEFDSTATLNDTFVRNLDPTVLQGQWKLYIINFNKTKGTGGTLDGWKLIFTFATENLAFPQAFDGVYQSVLPSGWINQTTVDLKAPWTTISTMPYAPANKLGAPGTSFLTTNFFTLEQGTLSDLLIAFNLMYYTKESIDGAVLEFQIQGEEQWRDITNLIFLGSIAYNGYITDNTNPISPLGNRAAWTGNSNGLTQIKLQINQLFYKDQSRTIRLRWVLGLTGKNKSPGVFIDNVLVRTITGLFMKFSFNDSLLPIGWSTSTEGNANPWTFIQPVSQPNLAYIPDLSVSELVQTRLVTPPVSFAIPQYIDFDLLWDLDAGKDGLILEIQQGIMSFNPVPKNQFVLNGYNGTINLIGSVDAWTGDSGNVYKHVRAILPAIPDGKIRLNLYYTTSSLAKSIAGPGLGVLVDNLQITNVNFDDMTPTVTDSITFEGVQTTTGLVISPPVNLNVQFYKITNISNGFLFQNDGITPILDNAFITVTQGLLGLKFTPNSLSNGSFDVQSSLIAGDLGLGGSIVTATITVIPFVPPVPCLHPNTLVWTTKGYKKISEIRGGDTVMGDSGLTLVASNMKFGLSRKFVQIDKGALGYNMPINTLIIKADHPILLNGEEVVPSKLVKKIKGVKKMKLRKPIAVWSISTKDRCFINMEGIKVCTWSESDPKLYKYQFEKY